MKINARWVLAIFFACSQWVLYAQNSGLKSYFETYAKQFPNATPDSGNGKKMNRLASELLPSVYPHGKYSEVALGFNSYYNDVVDNNPSFIVGKKKPGLNSLKSFSGATWQELGPIGNPLTANGVGRMDGVCFDPGFNLTNQIVYASSVYGGLWKSIDAGENWSYVESTANLPISSVGSLVIDQSNGDNLFISLGHTNDISFRGLGPNTGSSNILYTMGVFRSTNGGDSWVPINDGLIDDFAEGGVIRKLLINPTNANEIYAATSRGVYKTTNALSVNVNWAKIFEGVNSNDLDYELKGIEFKPNNTSILYASGFDIYKSSNSGASWSSMTGSSTGLDLNQLPNNFKTIRINVATTIANSDLLYAYIYGREDVTPGSQSKIDRIYLYKYDGTSWIQIHQVRNSNVFETLTSSRMALEVSPQNENLVYYGTTKVYGNQSGLTNFSGVTNYNSTNHHADVQDLVFEPNSLNPKLWDANDGGIAYTNLPATTNTWSMKNNGLSNATIWTFDHSNQSENYMIIGNQDNGVTVMNKTTQEWKKILGGDGYGAQISDRNENFAMVLSNSSSYHYNISNLISTSLNNTYPNDQEETSQKVILPPNFALVNHPITGFEYVGFTNIYKKLKFESSGSANQNWELNSDISKLSKDPSGFSARWTRQIQELEISESNPNYVYTAAISIDDLGYTETATGEKTFFLNPGLYRSKVGFSEGDYSKDVFEDISENLPKTTKFNITYPVVSGIALDPENEKRLWVSFVNTEKQLKVWRSNDAGDTWENADPNLSLPNVPIGSVTYIKGTNDMIILGTDAGIYYKDGSMTEWIHDEDFPNVRITEVRANYDFGKLRVATFGRGIWELNIASLMTSDLYMKDNLDDSGLEPNQSEPEGRMWISEDIWIRNTNDGGLEHQQPKYFSLTDNFVNIKIRNKGTLPSAAGNKIELYFNKARTDGRWPESWDGTDQTGGVPNGGKVGELTLPSVPAGEEIIVVIPWKVPDPLIYGDIERNHFCLLARIEEKDKPQDGFYQIENSCTWCNVNSNNNAVSKNVTVIGDSENVQGIIRGGGKGKVTVGNVKNTSQCTKLGFEVPIAELAQPITNFGDVKARLSQDLYDDWMNQGGVSEGLSVGLELTTVSRFIQSILGNYIELQIPMVIRTLKMEAPKAYIQLNMPPNIKYDITMDFRQDLQQILNPAQRFTYDLKHYVCETSSDVIIGGENYRIDNFQKNLTTLVGGDVSNSKIISPFVSPQEASQIDVEQIIASVNEGLNEEDFTISPNPTSDNLNIKLSAMSIGSEFNLYLFDSSGKLVLESTLTENTTIDISKFVKGIYSIVLFNIDNQKKSIKMVSFK